MTVRIEDIIAEIAKSAARVKPAHLAPILYWADAESCEQRFLIVFE